MPTALPTPTVPPTPTVTLAGATPTIKPGKVNIGIDCGAVAACDGTVAIENEPLVDATAAAKSTKRTSKGRTAAHKHQKLTVYIDITLGTGSSARRLDKKVTLVF